jgi:hypothetical protein
MGGECDARSTAFLVTHERLSVAMMSSLAASSLSGVIDVSRRVFATTGPTSVDVWQTLELDATSACARNVRLSWMTFGTPNDDHAIDDITAVGDACAAYVDADADGLCPAGDDLDGDGTCIGAGEPDTIDHVHDCDDAVAGTACLSLVQEPPQLGALMRVEATGADPGETVWFVVGKETAPDAQCHPSFPEVCVDVDRVISTRRVTADATGFAAARIRVPSVGLGTRLYVQAAVAQPVVLRSNLAWDVVQ